MFFFILYFTFLFLKIFIYYLYKVIKNIFSYVIYFVSFFSYLNWFVYGFYHNVFIKKISSYAWRETHGNPPCSGGEKGSSDLFWKKNSLSSVMKPLVPVHSPVNSLTPMPV